MITGMDVDLVLIILIAGLTIIVAGLGGHLASTKPWHKWVFWGLGIVMFVLIIFQATRNSKTQKDLQTKLDQIVQQRHTHIRFDTVTLVADDPSVFKDKPITPFRPQMKTRFNVNYQNVGTTNAQHVSAAGMVILTDGKPDLNEMFSNLRKAFNWNSHVAELVPQQRMFFTAETV